MKFSKEQIVELKKQHGELTLIEGDGKCCILKNPDRNVAGLAMSKIAQMDMVGAAEIIIVNCHVAGNEEFKTDTGLLIGAINQLQDLIGSKDVVVKKL